MVMVVVPLVVVQIAIQLCFCSLGFGFISIGFRRVVAVTLVEAPSGLSVLAPQTCSREEAVADKVKVIVKRREESSSEVFTCIHTVER